MADININQVKDSKKRRWFKEGCETAVKAPKGCLQIYQRKKEILESEVKNKISENEIRLEQLAHKESALKKALSERGGELSIKDIEMNFLVGISLLFLTFILWIAHFMLSLWTFEPYGWGVKAYVLVVGITIIGSILVERAFSDIKRLFPERQYLTWRLFLVMTAVVAVMSVGLYLAVIRGELSQITFMAQQAEGQAYNEAVTQFYSKSHGLLLIALPLLTLALEIGTGIMLHLGTAKIRDTWPVIKLYRALERLRERITGIEAENKSLESIPDVFEKEFLNGADLAKEELENKSENIEEYRAKRLSFWLIVFTVILLVLILSASIILADTVVVALDLSASAKKKDYIGETQFEKNKKAIEVVISKLKPDTRLCIIGITGDSLGTPYILLTASSRANQGYFKENIKKDKAEFLSKWQRIESTLKPKAPETDILGGIYLAESIFENHSSGQKHLIFLSDMRNSKGVNLETLKRIDGRVLKQLGKQIRIADLKGVNVYVYGAHVGGKTESYWQDLKRFWQGFFKNAGAEVVVYSSLREIRDY